MTIGEPHKRLIADLQVLVPGKFHKPPPLAVGTDFEVSRGLGLKGASSTGKAFSTPSMVSSTSSRLDQLW
jgi:hypothetical protein